MARQMDNGRKNGTLEVTPELTVKELLARMGEGASLDLTERGVVLAHVERASEEVQPFDREQVRAAIDEIDRLRTRIGSGLTQEEILDSIAEGRA
ncbi:MAG: hypothetical protein H6718_00115 [Polyangiaceae bacterium]|nr:hypothetical protein [Polyangiaceae bacterium]